MLLEWRTHAGSLEISVIRPCWPCSQLKSIINPWFNLMNQICGLPSWNLLCFSVISLKIFQPLTYPFKDMSAHKYTHIAVTHKAFDVLTDHLTTNGWATRKICMIKIKTKWDLLHLEQDLCVFLGKIHCITITLKDISASTNCINTLICFLTTIKSSQVIYTHQRLQHQQTLAERGSSFFL